MLAIVLARLPKLVAILKLGLWSLLKRRKTNLNAEQNHLALTL